VNVQHAETIASCAQLTPVDVSVSVGSVTVEMTVKMHLMNRTAVSNIFYIALLLQRVSIACYGERCTSYSESACPSVRPSQAVTVSKRLMLQSCGLAGDSPVNAVYFWLTPSRTSKGNQGSGGTE